MRKTEFTPVTPIWTQTTESMAYTSDGYDTDAESNGKSDGKKNRDPKKRNKFKMFNQKMDFSHVGSRTDSNYHGEGGHVAKSTDNLNVTARADNVEMDRLRRVLADVRLFFVFPGFNQTVLNLSNLFTLHWKFYAVANNPHTRTFHL